MITRKRYRWRVGGTDLVEILCGSGKGFGGGSRRGLGRYIRIMTLESCSLSSPLFLILTVVCANGFSQGVFCVWQPSSAMP